MNVELLDIHTHQTDGISGEAIINKMPRELVIEPGKWYSVGIHPWFIYEMGKEDKDLLYELVRYPQVIAIGEAGFDRAKYISVADQISIFAEQAYIAEETDKPLIIHMVKAADLLLAEKKKLMPKMPWIIHGFRGKPELANQLLDAGMYLSFGERYHVGALRATPLDHMFLETDEATCGIYHIYNKVAEDLGMDVEVLKEQMKKNIDRFFFKKKS